MCDGRTCILSVQADQHHGRDHGRACRETARGTHAHRAQAGHRRSASSSSGSPRDGAGKPDAKARCAGANAPIHPSLMRGSSRAGRPKTRRGGPYAAVGGRVAQPPRSYALPNSTMLLVSFLLVPADRSDGLPYGSSHPEPRSRAPPSHARHRPHRHSRALFPSRCPASTHTRTWRPGRKRRCVPRATRNALSSAIPPCLPAATVPEGCPKQLV